MANYTPSLFVSESTTITRVRELPVDGEIKVRVGDYVKADDVVLETKLVGDLEVIRIGDQVGLDGSETKKFLKVEIGKRIEVGDLLCEVSTFFGFFKTQIKASVSGLFEFFNEATGNMGIRLDSKPYAVKAYVPGKVIRIEAKRKVEIELNSAIIEGVFGIGGESEGILYKLPNDQLIELDLLKDVAQLSSKILFGGRGFSLQAFEFCIQNGVKGIVTGSIDSSIFEKLTKVGVGVSMSGFENIKTPIILTEGFGELQIGEVAYQILASFEGKFASINGLTQVRAGAVRPEIIIPNLDHKISMPVESNSLVVGARIRIVRGDNFGSYAKVIELPIEKSALPSGAIVRVVKIKLDSGVESLLARANIEILLK